MNPVEELNYNFQKNILIHYIKIDKLFPGIQENSEIKEHFSGKNSIPTSNTFVNLNLFIHLGLNLIILRISLYYLFIYFYFKATIVRLQVRAGLCEGSLKPFSLHHHLPWEEVFTLA